MRNTKSVDEAAKKINVDLVQTQAGEAYVLPLELNVNGAPVSVQMTGKTQRFEIPSEKRPDSVILDPNVRTLMKARLTML